MDKIFFNAEPLPESNSEYVCWLDVMGTRSIMSYSLNKSANFICKLHIAALELLNDDVRIYPLLDGMYITSKRKQPLLGFLHGVFSRVAIDFVAQEENQHRFIIKSAVAFGPVLHGSDIPKEASWELGGHEAHRNALLLGIPVIQAYQSERKAPPYGVYIHESARSFAPEGEKPLPYVWWKWFRAGDGINRRLHDAIIDYYSWCKSNSYALSYEKDRLDEHEQMAKEYLADEKDVVEPQPQHNNSFNRSAS
jgi:hypothetical protein